MDRDAEVRRNLENVFGLPTAENVRRDEHGNLIVIPNREVLEEARLTRDLRSAGLL